MVTDMKWLFKEYMVKAHIESFKELAKRTGIKERTLEKHIDNPGMFRLFELMALNEVLHFTNDDLLALVRGAE